METNDLKKYINFNRSEFEIYKAPSEGWEQLSHRLEGLDTPPASLSIAYSYLWKIAVGLALTIGLGLYFFSYTHQVDFEVAKVQETGRYYNHMIVTKVAEIEKLDKVALDIVAYDIKTLDVAFNELKNNLKDNVNNEEVIFAMMNNYKVKLEILERILVQLDAKK